MKRARAEAESDGLHMVKCLMLLSRVGVTNPASSPQAAGGFKCKTCNRVFPSFQALGGHRASHKRPKLMLSSPSHHLPLKLNRKHPCPICGLQFGIGQALGGHMRKHRAPVHNKHKFDLCLDLNLTPLENDHLNLNLTTTPLVHFFRLIL